MKICIESYLLNHSRRGGVMTYAEGLVNGTNVNDKENDYTLLYYSLRRQAFDMPGPDGGKFTKAVLKVPDMMFWGRKFIVDDIVLPAYLKKHKIDVFHRLIGYTMPKNKNIFNILTVHDLRTLTIDDKYLPQNVDQYKKTLSEVDLCVTVSECTKRDLIEYFGMDGKKIKVVHLGVDGRYRVLERDKVDRVKSKFNITQPYLLSIGTVPRKNIEGIIRGFAGCDHKNDYQLVLTCYLDVEKYKRLSHELGVGNRVVILNNVVSDEDIVALFNGCFCFLFPSLYEGFGLPILEAMNCGAPVITSNLSACPEVAGDAAILVDPKNSGEISDALNQMHDNERLRKSLIEKGFDRVKQFSWDKFAKEMKDIYSKA